MVSALHDNAPATLNLVHQTVFLRDPAGPIARQLVLERLRIPDAGERVAQAVGDESRYPLCNLPVGLNPVLVVGPRLAGERNVGFGATQRSTFRFHPIASECCGDDIARFDISDRRA